MKGDTKVVLVLFVLVMLFVCSLTYAGTMPQKTTSEIEMIQPCGWPWCMDYDAHYAEKVNEPNSRANENNAHAELYNAQAAYAKAKAEEKYMPVYTAMAFATVIIGFFVVIGLLFGLVWLIGGGRR